MHRDTLARAEIEVRLHGLRRIHVDVPHEPARLVGADREEGEIERAQPCRDFPPGRAIARVPSETDPTPGARTRRGPANETGLARSEYTGSVSRLMPAT